ncbi:28S ribosomal protein S18b, mitochondrial [Fopius arisanus]|uniref:Small ribosomal subunit protein mS40 n=1 Tax=Fopius arisanus TaxID=64838 RepID=A0A9R1T7K7_9HYME|nr:PREDICTED: 28S ribosomal protein S18b, mitochondrial [Fopius arisanus]
MASFLKLRQVLRADILQKISVRNLSRGSVLFEEEDEGNEVSESPEGKSENIHPSKDRRKPMPVETSIRYLASEAYKETYGSAPVWKPYRRNHKGAFPPQKTRKTCIRQGIITTGNACPICRDEYLVLDHRNTSLLNQFISEFNGEIISYKKTGICQKQHKQLLIAVHRAKDYGTITFDVPQRKYNYSDWYKPDASSKSPELSPKTIQEHS